MSSNLPPQARYLAAAVQALREDIFPLLESDIARSQMTNCLRILARLEMLLSRTPGEALLPPELSSLPDDIRDGFTKQLEIDEIPENVALSPTTNAGIARAMQWLETEDWLTNRESCAIAQALVAWESGLSRRLHDQLLGAERVQGIASDQSVRTHTLSARLEQYLRTHLCNDALSVRDFRMLPGGRARMTALFRLDGFEEWPRELVVHRDPVGRKADYPGVVMQERLLYYLHTGGLLVPRPVLVELEPRWLDGPFMIVERMPGSPPNNMNFFAPPPPSEMFALSLAEQLGKLHALATEPLREALPTTLADRQNWAEDLEWLIQRWNDLNHGPSITMGAIISWMRAHVHGLPGRRDVVVHGDMMQHNMLVAEHRVTAILDWESGRIGHPGEDIGYMRPMIEKIVPWSRFMEVYVANGGIPMEQAEIDFFTFRSYIWANSTMQYARNLFENGITDDIRLAEVGASLAPQFLDCIGGVINDILREHAT